MACIIVWEVQRWPRPKNNCCSKAPRWRWNAASTRSPSVSLTLVVGDPPSRKSSLGNTLAVPYWGCHPHWSKAMDYDFVSSKACTRMGTGDPPLLRACCGNKNTADVRS